MSKQKTIQITEEPRAERIPRAVKTLAQIVLRRIYEMEEERVQSGVTLDRLKANLTVWWAAKLAASETALVFSEDRTAVRLRQWEPRLEFEASAQRDGITFTAKKMMQVSELPEDLVAVVTAYDDSRGDRQRCAIFRDLVLANGRGRMPVRGGVTWHKARTRVTGLVAQEILRQNIKVVYGATIDAKKVDKLATQLSPAVLSDLSEIMRVKR